MLLRQTHYEENAVREEQSSLSYVGLSLQSPECFLRRAYCIGILFRKRYTTKVYAKRHIAMHPKPNSALDPSYPCVYKCDEEGQVVHTLSKFRGLDKVPLYSDTDNLFQVDTKKL